MLKVPRPEGFALFLLKCIGLGYLPLAAVGWATLRGRRWAIPLGVAQGMASLAYCLGHILGLFEVEAGGAYTLQDPVLAISYDLFLTTLALLLTLAYALAFIAERSRPASRTPA